MRHPSDTAQPAPGQRVAQPRCRRGILGRKAVHHAADHACVLARPVPACRDSERLGQSPDRARGRVWPGLSRAARLAAPARRVGRGPAADQQDVSVERLGQRLVKSTGV